MSFYMDLKDPLGIYDHEKLAIEYIDGVIKYSGGKIDEEDKKDALSRFRKEMNLKVSKMIMQWMQLVLN